jgi:basic amino acid/polyamine antiporter, APA family
MAGAVAVAVGMVIGSGIFKSPALVAQNAGSDWLFFAAWALGGVLSLIGALCYAELASSFPHAGGDYHFLDRAYGKRVAFSFAWARFAIINTGSLALLGFTLGDYLNHLLPLGPWGSPIYAAGVLIIMTMLNLRGLGAGVDAQEGLTLLLCLGLLVVAAAGLWLAFSGVVPPPAAQPLPPPTWAGFGLALVFVLLAFGGWSELATLSAELKGGPRAMVRALVISLAVITLIYAAVNWAFWQGLGLAGLAGAAAPASALLDRAFGLTGELLIVAVVAAAVITSINATIIVGARTTYAAAHDWPALRRLGAWDLGRGIPAGAVWAQSAVALALVALGTWTRQGFATLVDYTAPVFWLFLAGSGLAVIVLRHRAPDVPRPFKVPLYPWLPLLFAASSLGVMLSSVLYVRTGALVGLVVLGLGVALAWVLEHERAP